MRNKTVPGARARAAIKRHTTYRYEGSGYSTAPAVPGSAGATLLGLLSANALWDAPAVVLPHLHTTVAYLMRGITKMKKLRWSPSGSRS